MDTIKASCHSVAPLRSALCLALQPFNAAFPVHFYPQNKSLKLVSRFHCEGAVSLVVPQVTFQGGTRDEENPTFLVNRATPAETLTLNPPVSC